MLESLLFVRHGETPFNARDLVTGWQDPGLTAKGQQQAAAAGTLLRGLDLTALVISPLRRCRDTAAVLALDALPRRLDPDFRERGWGRLEGCPRHWRSDPARLAGAGIEPPDLFAARVRQGLARLDGRPVVVAHSGVFRALRDNLGLAEPVRIANGAVVLFRHKAAGIWEAVLLGAGMEDEAAAGGHSPT